MFNLIKSVISAGGYKLSEICHRIKKFYMLGDITESEMDELMVLASSSVSAEAERPEFLDMIRQIAGDLDTLKARLDALEGKTEEPVSHPAWKPWDGITQDYAYGAVVSHNGTLWESVFNGQNVWEPGTSGECFWKPYTE